MKIRKGKLKDLEELYKILNETPELYGGNYEGEVYRKKEVKSILTNRKTDLVLIAEEDKKIVGFLIAEMSKKKESSYLADIYVKPYYRKKGVASKLLEEYENICKKMNIEEIIGLTLKTNEKMHSFMEKNKYKRGKELIQFEKRIK